MYLPRLPLNDQLLNNHSRPSSISLIFDDHAKIVLLSRSHILRGHLGKVLLVPLDIKVNILARVIVPCLLQVLHDKYCKIWVK